MPKEMGRPETRVAMIGCGADRGSAGNCLGSRLGRGGMAGSTGAASECRFNRPDFPCQRESPMQLGESSLEKALGDSFW